MPSSHWKYLILCLLVLFAEVPFTRAAITCPGSGGTLYTCGNATGQVVLVWHAGSLKNAFVPTEEAFCSQTGISVCDYAAGSLDMVRQVTAGGQPADVVAPADYLDIDLFLKSWGYADYDIRFASGQMVLAYCVGATTGGTCGGVSKQSGTITTGAWVTPSSPTEASPLALASNWYAQLETTGVTVGGSHLYLDPSGYRAPMIFNLAQQFYGVANLYDDLLEHYVAVPATTGTTQSFKLGAQYDYSLTYMNNAYVTATTDPNYRYVSLPDNIDLGNPSYNGYYSRAVIVEPDLFGTGLVPLPATQVVWGATIMKNAPNSANAIAFMEFLLGSVNSYPTGGQYNLGLYGPAPIYPAEVSFSDYQRLPSELKPLVAVSWDKKSDNCKP